MTNDEEGVRGRLEQSQVHTLSDGEHEEERQLLPERNVLRSLKQVDD